MELDNYTTIQDTCRVFSIRVFALDCKDKSLFCVWNLNTFFRYILKKLTMKNYICRKILGWRKRQEQKYLRTSKHNLNFKSCKNCLWWNFLISVLVVFFFRCAVCCCFQRIQNNSGMLYRLWKQYLSDALYFWPFLLQRDLRRR